MGLNREERREKRPKRREQRKKREKRTEVLNQWREKFRGGIKYIYIFRILLQYNSNFRIVL